MTPEQQVAWDAMRSAYDEATVKRMERAADRDYVAALDLVAQDMRRDRMSCRHCGRGIGHNSRCEVSLALDLVNPRPEPQRLRY